MRKLIILGSSNKHGKTKKAVDILKTISDFDVLDLNDYNISYYDYEHKNEKDDYLSLMQHIISNYDILIFATPVYWYCMSGIMKVFFDRLTDLLDKEKELGRKLRSKSMAVITSSVGDNLGDSFWIPFIETAKYLGMKYIGNIHTIENRNESEELKKFVELINSVGK
ncbi:MAG TPA: NAD(P)H-dependent oxidoreductase [Saprospiraceae bacterium]|nr:NAD(P)H-dependent oxidoreductase [Saprospiraceae bacterium]